MAFTQAATLTWDIQSGGHLAVIVVNGELGSGSDHP